MSDINLFLKPESTLKLSGSVNTLISAPSFQHPTLGGSLSNLSNFLDSTDFSHNGSNVILKSLSYAKMADVPSENVSTLSFIQEPVAGYETVERMYPPVRDFTSATRLFNTASYGNGEYVVSYSSAGGGAGVEPFYCFNDTQVNGGHWADSQYSTVTGIYNGTSNIVESYKGEWLKIKLPVSIKLTKYSFTQRPADATTRNRAPSDFKIYGSTDNNVWTELIYKTSGVTYGNNRYDDISFNLQNYYTYYALVVNKLLGINGAVLNFDEWFIYGKEFIPSVQSTLIPTAADYKYLAFTYGYPTLTADATNLKAWYKFDDNFNDSSVSGYNLTNSAATFTDGLVGKAASFPNSASSLTTSSINLNSKTYSIAFWAKLNTVISGNGNRWFWSQSSSTGTGTFVGFRTDPGNDKLLFTNYGTGNDIDTPAGMSAAIGTNWNHYVVTYNNNDKKGEIWLNGSKLTTSPTSMTNPFSGGGSFTIGKSLLDTTTYFNGLMEDFRYYDKVLSQSEIIQLAANNSSPTQTSYTVNFPNPTGTLCDILVVGGGGGGGKFGGGGGAGAVLFKNTIDLKGSCSINVGRGGVGPSTIINGENGQNSSITINGTQYIAIGGGGGGARKDDENPATGRAGNPGGSGGGGSHSDNGGNTNVGGISTKITTYTGWESYGNNGGEGKDNITGLPEYASGGGGGAGTVGGNTISTGGGNGGAGKEFINYFGTGVGHNGWFAGGGGGSTFTFTTGGNGGYANGGNGLLGGGGNGGYDGSSELSGGEALPNTGGGGGGSKYDGGTTEDIDGGDGGSGIVIIRYKLTTGSNTPFKPPAILKYLPNPTPPTDPKWQPIINPSSTSDFLMTLSNSSNFSNLSTKLNTNYYDLYHSNIMSQQTDSYRIILNASIDHTSTDGNKYISSTLYYTKTPAIFFANCNLISSQPPSEWSFVNLTDRLRIGVTTSNFIPTLKVNL
jgi:hypothetical protein